MQACVLRAVAAPFRPAHTTSDANPACESGVGRIAMALVKAVLDFVCIALPNGSSSYRACRFSPRPVAAPLALCASEDNGTNSDQEHSMRINLTHLPALITNQWKYGSRHRRTWIAIVVLAVAFAGTSLGSMYYGMMLFKSRRAITLDQMLENLFATKLALIPHWVEGQFFAHPMRFDISMQPTDYAMLAQKRAEALQKGIMTAGENEFVPAFIQHDGKVAEVRMRLKGDWTDHLLGDKWSFRIKVKGEQTLLGMKQFSLHHPRARNFAYEWLFHRALAREDILALRYEFVDVVLNGKSLGIYALEEHFEKRLIESQRRREGPIVKMNEELLWADRAATSRNMGASPTGIQTEQASYVDAFGVESILDAPAMYRRFKLAGSLLESVRSGDLPAHKVFDVQRLATYFALCDLLGSSHAVVWHNMRFYYNPVTALLEPIGFDANAGKPSVSPHGAMRDWQSTAHLFNDMVFSDPIFSAEYTRALERVSKAGYLEALLDATHADLDRQLTILYKEFPYFHFSKSVFERNRDVILATLQPVKGLHAYAQRRTSTALEIEVGNIQGMPLEVESVTFRDSLTLRPSEPVILAPRLPTVPVAHRVIQLPLPADFPANVPLARDLAIHYRIVGSSTPRKDPVFAWPRQASDILAADLARQDPNVSKLPCFAVDEANKRIALRPGRWQIDESVLIPAGYDVVAGEDTELFLGPDVTILSYSRLDWRGSAEAPVVIRSDGRGRGMVVANAGKESILDHVHFLGLANPKRNGWEVTSAVSFYESPAKFTNCVFSDNNCEDALNMIRTTYTMENCLFANTKSDAFDADFADGRILGCRFVNCGNDAVDTSGSTSEVVDLKVEGTGDKGLSAGENSRMNARNVDLQDTAIGIASKDKSEFRIDGVRIHGSGLGVTLYQKKPEFGPASMEVTGLTMTDVSEPYLIENGSKLSIDGAAIAPNRNKVKDELYGKRYGRATRR